MTRANPADAYEGTTMTSGKAIQMRAELDALRRRHGVPPPMPVTVPSVAPTMDDVVVSGYAATRAMPLDRIMLRGWCFPILPWQEDDPPIPLLYKHDPNQIAGLIRNLSYDNAGQLRIRCDVTHSFAKTCGGFSISAKILAYELRQVDDPANFHAFVTSGELAEVSLTDVPADLTALVTARTRITGWDKSYVALQKSIDHFKQTLATVSSRLLVPASPVVHANASPQATFRREMTLEDRDRLRKSIYVRTPISRANLPASTSSFSRWWPRSINVPCRRLNGQVHDRARSPSRHACAQSDDGAVRRRWDER